MPIQKTKILLVFLFLSATLFAQELDDFVSLKSSGKLPPDFIISSREKFEKDFEENEDENLKKEFFLNTRFHIDELLLSGRILFNEPVSEYLNKIADYILREEPELRKELRFYVLKSNVCNAFSTDQGIILFTTGLFAQAENEAQVAYVVAHEIAHFIKKHVRKDYIETQAANKKSGEYKHMPYEEKISRLSLFDKSQELEADSLGVELYLNTKYRVDDIVSELGMLLYSYLPFEDKKYDPEFLDTKYLKIPKIFYADTITPITKQEDYDDEGSTHPNIKKRMLNAVNVIDDRNTKGDLEYVISESKFHRVQTMCRFESINQCLSNNNYGEAAYLIYLLNDQYPDNKFLDISLVKALYGMAKYKIYGAFFKVVYPMDEVEGESSNLNYFLRKLSQKEMIVIALRHAVDKRKKYPESKILKLYEQDLKTELATKIDLEFDDFKDQSIVEWENRSSDEEIEFDIEDSIRKVDESDLSRYEKIKRKRKLRALKSDDKDEINLVQDYILFAFPDLVKEENFIEELQDIEARNEEDNRRIRKRKKRRKTPDSLKVKRVVIVDPVVQKEGLKDKRKLLSEERMKEATIQSFIESYRKINMERSLISSVGLNVDDVETYNDIGLLFQWLNEISENVDMNMISSSHDQMEVLRKKYQADHFVFSAVYSFKYIDSAEILSDAMDLGLIFSLPVVVGKLVFGHNYFQLVAISVNAQTDQLELKAGYTVNQKGSDIMVGSFIYKVLDDIHNARFDAH